MTCDLTVYYLWKEPSLLSCLHLNLPSSLWRHRAHICSGTISHSVAQTGFTSTSPPGSASPGARITGVRHHTRVRAFKVFFSAVIISSQYIFQCLLWSVPSTMNILTQKEGNKIKHKCAPPPSHTEPHLAFSFDTAHWKILLGCISVFTAGFSYKGVSMGLFPTMVKVSVNSSDIFSGCSIVCGKQMETPSIIQVAPYNCFSVAVIKHCAQGNMERKLLMSAYKL